MMTSSKGNIFRVSGPLCGDFTRHRIIPRGALMFTLICTWINAWVNNREADDLRRHRPHYNVAVMSRHFKQYIFLVDNDEHAFREGLHKYASDKQYDRDSSLMYSSNSTEPLWHVGHDAHDYDIPVHGTLTRYVKLRVAHAPGMPGTLPRHRGLAIPTCITAHVWRTCRDR